MGRTVPLGHGQCLNGELTAGCNCALIGAMNKTQVRALVRKFGVSKLAKALGVSMAAVSKWSQIPVGRVHEVSAITGFTPEQLRPDVFRKAA